MLRWYTNKYFMGRTGVTETIRTEHRICGKDIFPFDTVINLTYNDVALLQHTVPKRPTKSMQAYRNIGYLLATFKAEMDGDIYP